MRKQTKDSFLEKVKINPLSGCWEWCGSMYKEGYGQVSWNGKDYLAHRISAWLFGISEFPLLGKNEKTTKFVLHKCDNKRCVNPSHLFVGTHTDNMQDAKKKGRLRAQSGELGNSSKITNRQAEEIRKKYANGVRQSALSAEYGVSQSSVSEIVKHKRYKASVKELKK